MQNNALWIETTPEGFRVRVKFLPMNSVEHKKASALLKNFQVEIKMVTTEGPLSVDLYFSPRVVDESQPVHPQYTTEWLIAAVESLGYSVTKPRMVNLPSAQDLDTTVAEQELNDGQDHGHAEPGEQDKLIEESLKLTDEQLEALTKPNPTDKPA